MRELSHLAADPRLRRGAAALVDEGLALDPGTTLVIAAARRSATIVEAICARAEQRGLYVEPWLLDADIDGAELDPVLGAIRGAESSVVITDAGIGRRLVGAQHEAPLGRHVHLIGATDEVFRQSVATSPTEVMERTRRIFHEISLGKTLALRNVPRDDALVRLDGVNACFSPGRARGDGVFAMPGGEIVVPVLDARGSLTLDAGAFAPHEGAPRVAGPFAIRFVRGRLVQASGLRGRTILEQIRRFDSSFTLRAIVFGAHPGVLVSIGVARQDRVMPSVRLVFASADAPVDPARLSDDRRLELVGNRLEVLLDGSPLMLRGRYRRGL